MTLLKALTIFLKWITLITPIAEYVVPFFKKKGKKKSKLKDKMIWWEKSLSWERTIVYNVKFYTKEELFSINKSSPKDSDGYLATGGVMRFEDGPSRSKRYGNFLIATESNNEEIYISLRDNQKGLLLEEIRITLDQFKNTQS